MGNDNLLCSHSGSDRYNLYYAILAFGRNRAFSTYTNEGRRSGILDLLMDPVDIMAEEQDQEDCSGRIPSSVYMQ